ncbi:MAG: TonB-dependent receptor domain-containing protein [Rhodospirillaceae bacterium]
MKVCDLSALSAHGGTFASTVRGRALTTVSIMSLLVAGTGIAQAQAPAQSAQAPAVEEIVVTGSRVVRDGYEAPTPLTVIGIEQLQQAPTENLADFVNQLPSVAGSATPQNSQKSVSGGTAGLNTLNLRNLGASRTLVLVDGQRSVGSVITGLVDVNNIPQDLVSRVDVVTGGASAAYGSDALSGVVNFILDKKYTGIKGEVSGGVTTYGDDRNWKVGIAAGTGFSSDRGHLLFSGELSHRDGILREDRDWARTGWKVFNNPLWTATNGLPRQLTRPQMGLGTATPGGIISSGPLRGIDFGPGGVPRQYNYGTYQSDPYAGPGGDWAYSNTDLYSSLDGRTGRQSVFLRGSYDVTDDINLFVQASWGHTNVYEVDARQYNPNNLTIKADNAFIPASVAAQMTALKLTTLLIGTMNADIPEFGTYNDRTTNRYVVGGNGRFDAFDNAWSWDAYFQKGKTRVSNNITNTTMKNRFGLAIDAVRGANGTIVCRSTLTNPTNGCVPYNILGVGVNSQAAIGYITEYQPHRNEDYTQSVAAANVRGEPFSTWAGPVSLALGIEHRRDGVFGTASANDIANNFFVGNFLGNIGHVDVTEGFVETVIPLAKDTVWAKSFDLNAAVRGTGYSVSGYVTTWKAGLTWAPIDDLRFRFTRSRDIRAPNLSELFAAGTSNTNNVNDPFNNNLPTQYQGFAVGNLALVPEKADTTGLGVVLQPQFFPGFSASVDYYNIDIGNAIGTVAAQNIVDFCFQGKQDFCAAITRAPNATGVQVIQRIRTSSFNFVNQNARGLDFEASYRTRLDNINSDWAGDVGLRFLATRYLNNYSNNGIAKATDTVGSNAGNGPPTWRWVASATYNLDPIDLALTARGVSSGTYNNSWIQCTSGCPVSTTNNPTTDFNHIDGAVYWDLNIAYKFMHEADDGTDMEAFLNIKNITNKDPAVVAQGPSGTSFTAAPSNPSLYDVLGRVFRAGVRFKLGAAAPMKRAEPAMAAAAAPPPPPPPPARPPAPVAPQKFLVFFDFDRSAVRADAQKIVEQAADYAKKNGKAVIHTTGHTDRAGTDAYNLALSERRAKAVEAELEKLGFTASQITISAKGESDNLIPTGDGVREPQNRRVEIVMDP